MSLEPGVYAGKLTAVSCGLNAKGNPQIEMIWLIGYAKDDSAEGGWRRVDPFERRTFLSMASDKATKYTFERLHRSRFTGDPSNPRIEDFPDQYQSSTPLDFWIEPAQGNYKEQHKWAPSEWNEGSSSSIKGAMDDNQQAVVAQQWENFKAAAEAPTQ